MAKDVIMPALGMAQETGTLIRWLKAEGDFVEKDEPLMEIETDKVTVEIDAPASGILSNVRAAAGDVVPVGEAVATIFGNDEERPDSAPAANKERAAAGPSAPMKVSVSPVAARMMEEHGIEIGALKPNGGQVRKGDVLAYLARPQEQGVSTVRPKLFAASPKARRLAAERGIELATLSGSGPDGAVLVADLPEERVEDPLPAGENVLEISNIWRVMVERMTHSWTTVPHFYLMREVRADRLRAWRSSVNGRSAAKVTFTDLLLRLVGVTLRNHPRLNASWHDGSLLLNESVNVGLAIAVEEGLIVPVLRETDTRSVPEIAARRRQLIERAAEGRLRPEDITGGTFTISNLGMYGVDLFNAVINPPQAAILAVGRIADRVVPVNGQPAVRPMMTLVLSCDHRVVDGARAAQFLDALATAIEEPLTIL